MDATWIIGGISIAISLIALIVGAVRWATAQHEKRVHGRFKEHKERLDKNEVSIRDNEKAVIETRDEMHRDYARTDQLNNFSTEIRDDFKSVFKLLTGMARDLNQLIGKTGTQTSAKTSAKTKSDDDD